MTTPQPQHAIDAAKEIMALNYPPGDAVENVAAIIAAHPDPELVRLREENESLKTLWTDMRVVLTQSRNANCLASYGATQADAVEAANRILNVMPQDVTTERENLRIERDALHSSVMPLLAERDQLRAEVERLQKAGTSWEAIELRAEVEHLKKEVQENQLRFPCRMTKEAYLSDAKTRQDLRARVAELELQTFDIKKLEVDKARLDWLEEMHAGCNHGPMDKPTMFHCWVEVSGRHENPADHFYGNTLRAAIDLAKGGTQ